MRRTAIESRSLAPAAARASVWSVAEVPAAKVTIYGDTVTAALGVGDGAALGEGVGAALGAGLGVGAALGVGSELGAALGTAVDGSALGAALGAGLAVGSVDGAGCVDGFGLGIAAGSAATTGIGANRVATMSRIWKTTSSRWRAVRRRVGEPSM